MRDQLIAAIRRNPGMLARLRRARVAVLGRLPGADAGPGRAIPAADWSRAPRGLAVPQPLSYDDVAVMPARGYVFHQLLSDGGPVWPDFDATPLLRHHVHGRPEDRNALPPDRPPPALPGDTIWGGRAFFHFGHLASEHLNRIPGALYHRPGARVLLTLQPGKLPRDVPRHVWDMLAWLGAGPDRVHFVTSPVTARRLHVAAQTEQAGGPPPPNWYLDLLDCLPALNALPVHPARALYVHRQGQAARGNGAHAGEAALVQALGRAGVPVLDPGARDLRSQLALYAGAERLIFAEGSAIHGRQLLGRLDQSVVILRRRPHSTMARSQLAPRCTTLIHAPVIGAFAAPLGRDGVRMLPHGLAIYNLQALFGAFRRQGIDLAPHWDAKAYRDHAARDLEAWGRAIMARGDIDRAATAARIAELRTALPG